MNYDDETLMAYADGELDAESSAAISAAIERDPVLAQRVERHRALRHQVTAAYASVLEQPVPERLLAAANAHLGRMDEAKRHVAALKKLAPETTVQLIWAGQPQRDDSRLRAVLDGLRLAGLEEG